MKPEHLNIHQDIKKGLEEKGFCELFEVQEVAIPKLLEKKDAIVQAKTGTGKTLAFAVPVLQHVNPEAKSIQALILVPTRELAMQVADEISSIGKHRGAKVVAIFGGDSMERQIRAIPDSSIAVATPGRLIDHHRRRTIDLSHVHFVVLDEADRMLDMGFIDDVKLILSFLPKERQTALFSATMPEPVMALAAKFMKSPERILLSKDELTVEGIEQFFYRASWNQKLVALEAVMARHNVKNAIIFCNTKRGTDRLAEKLARKYRISVLHGGLRQNTRQQELKDFKEGKVDFLIATDLAARGLDISDIPHIINYDVPADPEIYIHRIGRTARAGKTGTAITLVQPSDDRITRKIEPLIKKWIRTEELRGLPDAMLDRREGFFGRGPGFGGRGPRRQRRN